MLDFFLAAATLLALTASAATGLWAWRQWREEHRVKADRELYESNLQEAAGVGPMARALEDAYGGAHGGEAHEGQPPVDADGLVRGFLDGWAR